MPSTIYRCTKCGAVYDDFDAAYACEARHCTPFVIEEYNIPYDNERAKAAFRDIMNYNKGSAFPNAILVSVPVVDERGCPVKDEHGVSLHEYAVYQYAGAHINVNLRSALYDRKVESAKYWGEYVENAEVAPEEFEIEPVCGITIDEEEEEEV